MGSEPPTVCVDAETKTFHLGSFFYDFKWKSHPSISDKPTGTRNSCTEVIVPYRLLVMHVY